MPHNASVLSQQLLLAASPLVLHYKMWCPSLELCRNGTVLSEGQGRATWEIRNWLLWGDQSSQGHALSRGMTCTPGSHSLGRTLIRS